MRGISEFFEKIRNIQLREIRAKTAVQETIKNRTGIEVPLGSISIKNGTVTLRALGSEAKSAIYMKKAAILGDLSKMLLEGSKRSITSAPDIRW